MAHGHRGKALAGVASLALAAAAVTLAMLALARVQGRAESQAANTVAALPLGFSFAAGVVASVNPCGFFMLPSYVSFYLGTAGTDAENTSASSRLARAFLIAAAVTLGFFALLVPTGLVIAAGGRGLARVFPFAGLSVGVVMVLLGVWLLLSHRTLGIMAASRVAVTPRRSLPNMFLFGGAYAVASLSCTLPIFLVVVGSSLGAADVTHSLLQVASYGLGMGSALVAATVAAAVLGGALTQFLHSVIPHVHRVSALFLIASGSYLVYYWLFFADSLT